jgi:ParB family transcriptional regulator, chromosome partitioning protein
LDSSEIRIEDMRYATLPLAKINLKDERFRTSYFFSLERLILSIEKAGLLSPPLVRQAEKGYILVAGWKRVLACREIGLSSIKVLVTEDQDDLRLFLASVHENLASRGISLVEKAEILRKLLKFGVPKRALLKGYLPLLSLPATGDHLDVLIGLSRAEDAVKKLVWEKDVPLLIVHFLLRFKPVDQRLLLPLLRPLGQNKQREILEDLWEISRRDNKPLQDILDEAGARRVLGSPKLSPQQEAEKMRLGLKRIRYPQLSYWEDRFKSARRRIRWPKDIAIHPSLNFEGEEISISFLFKNEKEFKARLEQLQAMARKKEFPEFFGR